MASDDFQLLPGTLYLLAGPFRSVAGAFPNVAGAFRSVAGTFPNVAGAFPRVAGTFPTVAGAFRSVAGAVRSVSRAFRRSAGALRSVADAGRGALGPLRSVSECVAALQERFRSVAAALRRTLHWQRESPAEDRASAGRLGSGCRGERGKVPGSLGSAPSRCRRTPCPELIRTDSRGRTRFRAVSGAPPTPPRSHGRGDAPPGVGCTGRRRQPRIR